jgi:maltose O-acetyltransferase
MNDRELTAKEKMLLGQLYDAMDPGLVAERQSVQAQLLKLNQCELEGERMTLLRNLLGDIGVGTYVRSPLFCDYGYNLHLGERVFVNFNCVFLDVVPIRLGDGTQIGPGVQILAADHPRGPQARLLGLEFGKPITVGKNVWIGGGAILLPGITIGDDAVIGAGSVVTKHVAAGETVAGNPARLLRRR